MIELGSFQDMINDMNHGLYDFTHDGKCSQCGSCCSNYLPVTQKELNKIHRYVNNHNIKQAEHGLAVLSQKAFDMTCPFLDTTKPKEKCLIYPVRPQICKEFICNGSHKCSLSLVNSRPDIVDMRYEFYGN